MQFIEATASNGPRVAVIGGGVTGLTCAIPLMQKGVDVHVYEAAVSAQWLPMIAASQCTRQSRFGEIGAGLGVGMR